MSNEFHFIGKTIYIIKEYEEKANRKKYNLLWYKIKTVSRLDEENSPNLNISETDSGKVFSFSHTDKDKSILSMEIIVKDSGLKLDVSEEEVQKIRDTANSVELLEEVSE